MMKNLIVIIGVLFLGIIALACKFSQAKIVYPAIKSVKSIDDIVKPYLENKLTKGLAIGIIKDGKTEFYNYGIHSDANPITPTEKSIFEIGSISKTFTTTVLVQMLEEDLLSLDDPISKYLPDSVITWPSEVSITIKELATHSSGLPRIPINLMTTIKDMNNPYADYMVKDLYEFLKSYKPIAKNKRKVEYSNLGMGLLGHILSMIEKKDYETMVKDRIFDKLKMNNSMIELNDSAKALLMQGHNQGGQPTSLWDFPTLTGAGAIRSNTQDMLKYIQEHLKNPLWAKAHIPIADFGGPHKIGLAWISTPSKNNTNTMLWHNGGTGGFVSFCGMVKAKKLGVVVLSNSTVSVDEIGVLILKYLGEK